MGLGTRLQHDIGRGRPAGCRLAAGPGPSRVCTPSVQATSGTWKPSVMTEPQRRSLLAPPYLATSLVTSVRSFAW